MASASKRRADSLDAADPLGEQDASGPIIAISDREFAQVRTLAFELAGISIGASKKTLVVGRLGRRLLHHRLRSFADYLSLLKKDKSGTERQIALDLLTTNETYFFREPKHFDFLRREVLPRASFAQEFRVWSAAASSGEEAYSVAMLLAATRPSTPWNVLGTDVSSRVLETARRATYDLSRAQHIPKEYLRRFCLQGHGPQAGKLKMARSVRERVRFEHANLNEPLANFGRFDVILLRNVLIYFDAPTKQRVIRHLLPALKPGGYFIIGHCDALAGVEHSLVPVIPSIYRVA